MNWQPLIEFVVSLSYGILSAVVPIFNSEIYIVASQVGGFTAEVTTAVGCAVGQTIGKGRHCSRPAPGRRFPSGAAAARAPAQAGRSLSDKAASLVGPHLGLLGKRWWGVLIVFLSACVYIPPLYAVTLAVPATRMSVISFGVAVLLGRILLFLAIAFGVSSLFN